MNGFAGQARRARNWVWASIALLSCMLGAPAAGAEYPDHIINGVIPFGTGGPSDVISRIVATAMSRELGKNIVMLNKPGAGGNTGIAMVTSSKPDGYTLLYCSIATTQNPATYKTLPYDPLKDLMAVAILAESPNLVAVSAANIQAKTLREFMDLVKKNPGKYHLGGAGGQRMTMEQFMMQLGLKMEIINYKSAADAATAMMSGEIDAQLNNVPTLGAGVRSGRIRLLAVTSVNRLKAFPEVPTTPELGFPEYVDSSYIGLYAPVGMPAEIVSKLHSAAMRALASPEVLQRFNDLDFVPSKLTQPQADAFYRSEIARWKDVVRKANIPLVED